MNNTSADINCTFVLHTQKSTTSLLIARGTHRELWRTT